MNPEALTSEATLAFITRSGAEYRSTRVVRARRLDTPHEWTTSKGDALVARAGDWVLSDGDREWTVDAGVFRKTYLRNPDGTYSKVTTVRAVQVKSPVSVCTMEGEARACSGDWLVANVSGEVWPVPGGEFEEVYTPV